LATVLSSSSGYIKDEILIVFASCSTEAVLPQMITKLENVGCAKPVVGMVLPAGYAFNPDGTSIYLTMASIFIAQATNTPLTLRDQLTVLLFLLASSKGSAGVAGAGFIALAGSLAATGKIPLIGLALLLGVERFVNAARAVTNLIGNGVATVVIARWEKALDRERVAEVLERGRMEPSGRKEEGLRGKVRPSDSYLGILGTLDSSPAAEKRKEPGWSPAFPGTEIRAFQCSSSVLKFQISNLKLRRRRLS